MTAALLALYTTLDGSPSSPDTDAVDTMAPPPLAAITGTACLAPRKTERTLTAITSSQSSSGSVTAVPGRMVPALLNKPWRVPKASTAVATMRATSGLLATSTWHATAWPPASSICSTVSLALFRRMSAATTAAPSAAKRSALARPMPEPAPVTITTLSCSSIRASSRTASPGPLTFPWGIEASGVSHVESMLSAYRVVDLADHRGLMAGFILASLGAEVITVEPPEGNPARRRDNGLTWWAYSRGKASVVCTSRHELLELVRGADVLIETDPA